MSLLQRMGRRLRGKAQTEAVTELLWVGPEGTVLPTVADGSHPLAFSINAWVYACVTAIADAVAAVPMTVQEKTKDGWEDVETHPLIDLLSYVNSDLDSYMLLEQTAAWIALHGNAYWLLLSASDRLPPSSLQVLRADKVKVKPGKGTRSGTVAGYVFGEGAAAATFADIDVVHFRTFSPTDPHYGQSPIKVLESEINAFTSSSRYNAAFFKGGGVPAAVLSTEADLDDDTIKRYRTLWDNWTASSKDTRRPLILGRNLKLDVPGVAPDTVAVTDLPRMLRETICAVIGVPPAIVGIYEYANYANVREQRRIFWEGTVVPLARRIAGAASEQLAPLFGDGLRVEADISGLAALQPDYVELANAAQVLVDRGIMTRDEVRADMFGRGALGGDWGTAWFGPFSTVMLASASSDASSNKNSSSRPADAPLGGTRARLDAPSDVPPHPEAIDRAQDGGGKDERRVRIGKTLRRLSETARVAHYKAFNARRDNETTLIKAIVQDWYEELADEMLSNIEADKALGRLNRVKDPRLDDLTFASEEAGKRLGVLLLPVISDLLERSGQEAIAEIAVGISFDITSARSQAILRSRTLEMLSVAERAQGRVRDSLAEALAEGETIEQMTARIADWMRVGKEAYAETVARTETGIVMNTATYEGYVQGGATGNEWLSVPGGPYPRDHQSMDGVIAAIDELFTLPSGETCLYPQDPNLSVDEVAQCACTHAPVIEE